MPVEYEFPTERDWSLQSICRVASGRGSDTFVGVRVDSSGPQVIFPFGYALSSSDDELRREIIDLIRLLRKFPVSDTIEPNDFQSASFPIDSYIYLVVEYLSQPKYIDFSETYSSIGGNGTIDWVRTLKRADLAAFQDGDLVFPRPLKNRAKSNATGLLSLAHQYCVYASFLRVGWLFTTFVPNPPRISFDVDLLRSACIESLGSEFNDVRSRTIHCMLDILQTEEDPSAVSANIDIGTNRFEYVWESAVSSIFENIDKKLFFPGATWTYIEPTDSTHPPFTERAARGLEPDSVMIHAGSVFVLDSKFYKFGDSFRVSALPGAADLSKQMAYAQFASIKAPQLLDDFDGCVYSAFILPYDSSLGTALDTSSAILAVGHGSTDWLVPKSPQDQVALILVDTRQLLIEAIRPSGELRAILARSIREYFVSLWGPAHAS